MLTGAVANLLLNGLIIVLLSATIGYCWILNRRIKILQDSKGELALLLKHFDESTKRASESIIALQTASKKIGENIQFKIEKANFLLDDLTFMFEKGDKLANRMEASLAVNRARSKVLAEEPAERPARPSVPEKPSRMEYPLTESDMAAARSSLSEKVLSTRDKTIASLEAVLERVSNRPKSDEDTLFRDEPPSLRGASQRSAPVRHRSKSEQELLDMIKAGVKG